MEPIIETKKLTYTYSAGTPFQHDALRAVDFRVYPGEYLGIIGHTGSGKSTLIQHLNGLLKPTSGEVCFRGEDIWAEKGRARTVRFQVGLVFQYPEYQLFEETVYKDIAFGPTNMKLDSKEIDRRVRTAAEFVGLDNDLLEMSPFDLSGGQKRRAAIAGVIAMEPSVLILDEPTAGLDPLGREGILSNIRDYHREKNAAVVLVTHSMEEAARMVDRIAVVNDGTIPLTGTPEEIFARDQELRGMGLDVPQVTQVFRALRSRGIDLPPVYTVEAAVRVLRERLGVSSC